MSISKSVAIAGSRDVDRETARHLFEQHLAPLTDQGRRWMLGGARGIDQWAIEWLLERNEVCWAVVPYTRFRAPKTIQPWLEEVERVVELDLPRRKSAYAFRNRYLVDLCGVVFGFRSGKGSGTLPILKYALRKQREVHAIPVLVSEGDTEWGDKDSEENARLIDWPRRS